MKSRITIEVDFDNGRPYIKVQEDKLSDDVRDKLITFFRQRLQHTSSWCGIEFRNESELTNTLTWFIRPITPDLLEDQCRRMSEQVAMNKKWEQRESISH